MRRDDYTDAYGRSRGNDDGQDVEYTAGQKHRKSYDRYFEGYSVRRSVNEKGRTVSYRVYTGDRYVPQLTERQRQQNKWLYAGQFVLALALAVGGLCLDCGSNYLVWPFVLGCVPVAACGRLFFALLHYWGAGEEAKINEYRNGTRVLRESVKVLLGLGAGVFVLSLLVLPLFRLPFRWTEGLRAMMLGLSPVVLSLPGRRESSVTYTMLEGQRKDNGSP